MTHAPPDAVATTELGLLKREADENRYLDLPQLGEGQDSAWRPFPGPSLSFSARTIHHEAERAFATRSGASLTGGSRSCLCERHKQTG